jgi:hypothetical protein
VRVGRVGTLGAAAGIHVVGNYAYVAERDAGLQVFDVSNPTNPVLIGGYNLIGYVFGVQVVGNYAYLANYSAGLRLLDVSNPANPLEAGGIVLTQTFDVQVAGNYAYVADGIAGVQVIDVSNPVKPVRVGGYDTNGQVSSVQVVGSSVYVVDDVDGLQILELKLRYPQTLDFHLPTEVILRPRPADPIATASSGLLVTLSVVSGPATLMDNQITWTGFGPVTLRAEQAGDDFFLPGSGQWTVNVIPRRLGARLAGAQFELFWATGFAGLQLQGRTSLTPDSAWQNITTPPVEDAGEARVRLDAATPLRYFRLLQP